MYARVHNKPGLTLIEMTLVIATIALMVGFGVPAVRSLMHSFQTQGGTRSMIDAALSSAQAMAMTQQQYVGIRFQKRCTSNDAANPLRGLVDAPQYMIFVMHDPKGTGLANGFRAVEGMEPIKLPDMVGVTPTHNGGIQAVLALNQQDNALSNATAFSIVFSPSGRLVTHPVRVRNRDGVYQPNNSDPAKVSHDEVFNSVDNICLYKEGMFIQDDYSRNNVYVGSPNHEVELGLGEESSVTEFAIYDAPIFHSLYPTPAPQMELRAYLTALARKPIYVNSYTGQSIASD